MAMQRALGVAFALAAMPACGPDDDNTTTTPTAPPITGSPLADPSGQVEDSSAEGAESTLTGGGLTEGVTGGPTTASTSTSSAATSEPTTDPATDPSTDPSTPPPDTTTGGLDDTGADTTAGDATTDPPPKMDMGLPPDMGPPPVCLQCGLTIASMQSGVLDASGGGVFATAQLQGQDVYAIGTYGSGRFIATADSSLPFNEVSDCPLTEWLAANGGVQPKVMIFGWGPGDGPGNWNVQYDKFGIHLPPQYIGNPGQLAADYDIVMYLEGSGQFGNDQPSDQEIDTLLDFITAGGGAYVSSEFFGYLNDADIASVNRLLTPLGSSALPQNLNWGNVDGQIDFECFPEPQ